MATYNGASYVLEQLESIANQTVLPHELIVYDDCSSDDTVDIVRKFAENCCFSVRIFVNQANIGCSYNFSNAITKCSGDLVILCDQDNVWYKHRIERLINYFAENNDTTVLMSNCDVADEKLRPTGSTLIGQAKKTNTNLDLLCLGCCTAFRSELIPIICPIERESLGYDWFICNIGLATDKKRLLAEPLFLFRRHQTNTSTALSNEKSLAARVNYFRKNIFVDRSQAYYDTINSFDLMKRRFQESQRYLGKPDEMTQIIGRIENRKKLYQKRLGFLKKGFFNRMRGSLTYYFNGHYSHFSGLRSCIRDILLG
jgi:glycosyltransferase involved in cell wall biosynthesis